MNCDLQSHVGINVGDLIPCSSQCPFLEACAGDDAPGAASVQAGRDDEIPIPSVTRRPTLVSCENDDEVFTPHPTNFLSFLLLDVGHINLISSSLSSSSSPPFLHPPLSRRLATAADALSGMEYILTYYLGVYGWC
jgi:hypothetical protein